MRVIDLKLTYKCNNDCKYCCQDRQLRKIESNLSFEKIKTIIEKELINGIDKVVLTGGEPTLHRNIVNITSFLKESGINNIQLQSNGKMLSDKILLNELLKSGINGFAISLHGNIAEIHEAFSGTKGSFLEVIQALENIKQEKIPVSLNCVITRHNIDKLSDIALFVEQNEYAKQLQFAFIHITGKARSGIEDYIRISEAAEVVKKVIDENNGNKLKIFTEAIPFCLMYGHEKSVSELYNNATVVTYDFHERRNFTENKLNSFKSKRNTCNNCIFNEICEGTWREYPDIFGFDEFIPVTTFREIYDRY